jgi:hypothetical protein
MKKSVIQTLIIIIGVITALIACYVEGDMFIKEL